MLSLSKANGKMPSLIYKTLEHKRIRKNSDIPDNWMFKGTLSDQYKQIGNAVPVNLAYGP